jgi:hypothetical protein
MVTKVVPGHLDPFQTLGCLSLASASMQGGVQENTLLSHYPTRNSNFNLEYSSKRTAPETPPYNPLCAENHDERGPRKRLNRAHGEGETVEAYLCTSICKLVTESQMAWRALGRHRA